MKATDLDKAFWHKVKKFRAGPYDWRNDIEKTADEVGPKIPHPDTSSYEYGRRLAYFGFQLDAGLEMHNRSHIKDKDAAQFTSGYKSVPPKDIGSKWLTNK